jgi:hypothetical protein
MNKWAGRVILTILCAGIAFLVWRVFFPNHEQLIRKQLTELAALCSFPPNQPPLSALKDTQRAVSFCSPDVEILINVPNFPVEKISGRDDLLQKALAAHSFTGGLQVEFFDIAVKVAPDRQSAGATLTGKARAGNDKDFSLQELKFTLKRNGRGWLISRVETLKTF